MKQCECGCGQSVTQSENRFLRGHNSRGMKHPYRSRSLRPPGIPADPNNSAVRFIPLTQNLYATVDTEDYARLMEYDWHIVDTVGNMYAATTIDGEEIYMQLFLMNPPEGMITVHLDADSLNNRKANLRNATQQQATWTRKPMRTYGGRPCSSHFRGVNKAGGSAWKASIIKDGLSYNLGVFTNEREAAHAWDKKARELYGCYAFQNLREG